MWWIWVVVAVLVLVGLSLLGHWLARPDLPRVRTQFEAQRGHLQAQFFQAAAASGKPRGLRWTACEWAPAVEFAREKATGHLAALAGVTIQFEAVEGSDMEGLAAVGNLRNASAVFFFHGGQWHTTGKTVFNLNPDEALVHFKGQYERLTEPDA
jgi:hypothetical protein